VTKLCELSPFCFCTGWCGGRRFASITPPHRGHPPGHHLPLRTEPNPEARHGYDFCLDADALPLQFARGLPRPVFVGELPSAAASSPASEGLAADLLARFGCNPVFLEASLHTVWPTLFAPSSSGGGISFNTDLYRAYLTANTQYVDWVLKLLNPDEDRIFVCEYHLLALPGILRHKSPRARIGFFFVHSPFPTSELFGAITVREDLLRALLNADVVGFYNDGCACNLLHTCASLLGTSGHSDLGINYHGHAVVVKILSVGVEGYYCNCVE
jgi:trehalose 6-phosphate synthase/phosphatase